MGAEGEVLSCLHLGHLPMDMAARTILCLAYA